MKRRGRPRKPGKRWPGNGNIVPQVDHGTPEIQLKRASLVGEADPALSASAPGILHANGHLDKEQLAAAIGYRGLRSAVFGPPWPTNAEGGEITDDRAWQVKRQLARLDRLLTVEQRHVVSEVAVFDRVPTWFYCARLGLKWLPEDHRERALLLSGLDALLQRTPQALAA